MMLLAVIVGGSGRFFGPVLGTVIIILLPEWLRSSNMEALKFMQKWYLVFFGVAVVALMVWLPGGLLSIGDRFREGARGEGEAIADARSSRSRTCGRPTARSRPSTASASTVGPGEIVGVIGPNGSGKTTLFNSILGQIRPTSGASSFCGEDITGMSPLELVAARRRPHVPDAAGVRQAVGARQPDRRRAGVQGHAGRAGCSRSPTPGWASTPTR